MNEEKLLIIISLNVIGLPEEFRSDAVLPKTTSTGELFIEGVEFLIERVDEDSGIVNVESEIISEFLIYPENTAISNQPKINDDIAQPEKLDTNLQSNASQIETKKCEWNLWTPNSLKSKKHPALSTKKAKDYARNSINVKLETLMNIKIEVTTTQKEMLIKETERQNRIDTA
ncbi:hypothetical protein ABEB36_009463 [Hypothenemus hampei]|uniref:Uncharacterized protein n=1 Tax=Hypothenemus hampei TaxID=57062 RepID=A0ABD1EGF0_HYPHA